MNELNRKGEEEEMNFRRREKLFLPEDVLNKDSREYIAPYFRRPIKQNFYDASYIAPPENPSIFGLPTLAVI